MNFDLRLPIGILFTFYGVALTGYGVATRDTKIYERSLNININLTWGACLLAFGLVMWMLAWRGQRSGAGQKAMAAEPQKETACNN